MIAAFFSITENTDMGKALLNTWCLSFRFVVMGEYTQGGLDIIVAKVLI